MSAAEEIPIADAAVEHGITVALGLLANRDHSVAELRRKLSRRIDDAAVVEAVLSNLQGRRLLDDRRFAEEYVDQRIRKGYGPLKIRAELAGRGVDSKFATLALSDDDEVWLEQLEQVVQRRFGSVDRDDWQAKGKQGRFLEQRGFPTGLIRRYLGGR